MSRYKGVGNPRKRRAVIRRDGWACWICGNVIDPDAAEGSRGYGSLDHVVPRSAGGSGRIENLRLAHISCNTKRGNSAA